MSSLDPRMRVRDIIAEPLVGLGIPGDHPRAGASSCSRRWVYRPRSGRSGIPHQFSGGQRQRISIARALAPRPRRSCVADEPVARAGRLGAGAGAQPPGGARRPALRVDPRPGLARPRSVVRHVCERVAVMKPTASVVEIGARPMRMYDAPTSIPTPASPGRRSAPTMRARRIAGRSARPTSPPGRAPPRSAHRRVTSSCAPPWTDQLASTDVRGDAGRPSRPADRRRVAQRDDGRPDRPARWGGGRRGRPRRRAGHPRDRSARPAQPRRAGPRRWPSPWRQRPSGWPRPTGS
jgi:hypothetical protein